LYQSHAPNLVVCVGDIRWCRSPNGAKGTMGLITTMAQKGAISLCEANIRLSKNLAVMLLCNGHALTHAV